jgi:hypothetical protein
VAWLALISAPVAEAGAEPGAQSGAQSSAQSGAPSPAQPAAQDGPQRPRFEPPVAPRPAEPLGADGKPLVPGVLPAATSEAARAAWRTVCAATRVPPAKAGNPATPPAAIGAFDLTFNVIAKPGSVGVNTTDVRFRFLGDPGYLRYTLESGREHVRGPQGDWLIAGERKERLVGDRYAGEDRQQIDQGLAIARNFVALTDPGRLRIASLAVVPRPPFALPAVLEKRAGELAWLDVRSPDFHLFARRDARTAAAPVQQAPMFRVLLGHTADGRVQLALVQEDRGAATALDPGALLVDLREYEPLDGFMVPLQLVVYEVEEGARPPAFRGRETMDLYRDKDQGSLRPRLAPDDFLP